MARSAKCVIASLTQTAALCGPRTLVSVSNSLAVS